MANYLAGPPICIPVSGREFQFQATGQCHPGSDVRVYIPRDHRHVWVLCPSDCRKLDTLRFALPAAKLTCPMCRQDFAADHNNHGNVLRNTQCTHGATQLFVKVCDKCPICYEEMTGDQNGVVLACGHVVCKEDFIKLGGGIGATEAKVVVSSGNSGASNGSKAVSRPPIIPASTFAHVPSPGSAFRRHGQAFNPLRHQPLSGPPSLYSPSSPFVADQIRSDPSLDYHVHRINDLSNQFICLRMRQRLITNIADHCRLSKEIKSVQKQINYLIGQRIVPSVPSVPHTGASAPTPLEASGAPFQSHAPIASRGVAPQQADGPAGNQRWSQSNGSFGGNNQQVGGSIRNQNWNNNMVSFDDSAQQAGSSAVGNQNRNNNMVSFDDSAQKAGSVVGNQNRNNNMDSFDDSAQKAGCSIGNQNWNGNMDSFGNQNWNGNMDSFGNRNWNGNMASFGDAQPAGSSVGNQNWNNTMNSFDDAQQAGGSVGNLNRNYTNDSFDDNNQQAGGPAGNLQWNSTNNSFDDALQDAFVNLWNSTNDSFDDEIASISN